MQLVLGARVDSGFGTAGAPLPAPPDRWRLGERGRQRLRRAAWAIAFALLAALGALHGATVAIGASGVGELASAPPPPGARADEEPSRAFWRPEGSNAERPPVEIAPRRWRPESSH
jgi:hypothetical protein